MTISRGYAAFPTVSLYAYGFKIRVAPIMLRREEGGIGIHKSSHISSPVLKDKSPIETLNIKLGLKGIFLYCESILNPE
jgi:hypothetical protein